MDQLKQSDVNRIAFNNSLPPELLTSIISIESSGNSNAVRFESEYRYLWDCKGKRPFRKLSSEELLTSEHPAGFSAEYGSKDTEWMGQKTSWGPMQIMGAVAREYGFLGPFPVLCGILGVKYGAEHLAKLRNRYYARHGWDGVIAAYNAGSPRLQDGKFVNQRYVNKVKKEVERIGGAL